MVEKILPLVVRDALVRRRGKVLVGPVNLTVAESGFTIVIGPNGSGKTTLLRMMHGIERLSGGTLNWAAPVATARKRQSFVFQTPIVMRRNVRDNLAFPLQLTGTPRNEARQKAEEWTLRCDLKEAFMRPARVLSGGERQKLALARALIRSPEILFLDEPCANLDGRATREIEELLREANCQGTRIVMSTHDMGQARRLADDIWFIYKGLVHETGAVERFFDQPATKEAQTFIDGGILE